MEKREVVITGLGSISPLGVNCTELLESLKSGKSGISLIEDFDTSAFPVKFAGTVKNFSVESLDYDQKILARVDPFMHYLIGASLEAIESSDLISYEKLDKARVGVILGSGIGGLTTIEANHQVYREKSPRRIAPSFIPGTIINMPSGHIAMKYGFMGPNLATTTACTTGTHCLSQAFDLIKLGYADVMIAGSGEKASTPLGMGGFASARALSTRNESYESASRPWDLNRDGFVLSDGAATLVLEEKRHAQARGAQIIGELLSVGYSADAYHMTLPREDGLGAKLAIEQALSRANLAPEQIDHINTHSTSTIAGDLLELKAIKALFRSHSSKVILSATKSMTGHLLGAAGSLEAVISLLCLKEQIIAPTINVENPDPLCDQFTIAFGKKAKKVDYQTVLSNSFGFGGTNGCLIFQRLP